MKRIWQLVLTVSLAALISIAIQLLSEGMPLLGVPDPQDVAAVTLAHPELTETVKSFDDSESIDLACKLPNFLRYSLWEQPDGSAAGAITISYALKDGGTVSLSANRETVWWKGATRKLKDDETFVKLTEAIFFSPEVLE